MKTIRMLILSVCMVIASISTNTTKAQVSVGADITFNVFYNGLSPYGHWVNHPSYGQVWVCNTPGFVPYRTAGHWVYTDDGWTWVSDYSWGWAPFHYGRWDYDAAYGGYFWVPGYEWGPAWVSWRSDDEVYGWAPLRPGVTVGVGISFGADIPAERWTFVPTRYVTSPYVSRYYVNNSRNITIIHNTTIINNAHANRGHVTVVEGPHRADVEKVTHARVNTYSVAASGRPGAARVEKNTVNIYRPVVNKTTVVNREVVNNNKVVINKNSNNKTVVNNSNNRVVNKNERKVTTTNKATVNNSNTHATLNNSKKTTVNHKSPTPQKNAVRSSRPATSRAPQHAKPAPKQQVPKQRAVQRAENNTHKPAAKPHHNG
ncbi:MAG TPA: DUF6600 domain-containing protein [Chitinophagaceae bacterium]|nr:DUF6600 domain-containing protein [Chitinophagaceae bacterium]